MTSALAEPTDVGARGTMNPERADKVAAKRLGITVAEYIARREVGEKWCHACRQWHLVRAFGKDSHRQDGLANLCRDAVKLRNLRYNATCVATNPRRYHTGGRPAHCTYEQVWERQQRGMSLPEIARDLGCSLWSVRRAVERATQPEKYEHRLAELREMGARRRGTILSLDAPIGSDKQRLNAPALAGYLVHGATVEDAGERDKAERLRAIVGDMEPEDVRLLNSETLARLQDRLRAEGLVPRGVQQSERERLRDPERHAGTGIVKSKSRGGRKTRKQRMEHTEAKQVHRGGKHRPKQKARKRWTRDTFEEAA